MGKAIISIHKESDVSFEDILKEAMSDYEGVEPVGVLSYCVHWDDEHQCYVSVLVMLGGETGDYHLITDAVKPDDHNPRRVIK